MAPYYIFTLILISLIFPSSHSFQIDYSKINIDGIRQAILMGTSCVDVIDQFLKRIETYEKGPLQLNALVNVNRNAKEEAAELDKHFHRTRSLFGTLHCVPIVVGDNIDVAHLATTVGVRALQESIATRDADIIHLLKIQGAIVVGKGNISPFTWEHRYVESQTAGLAKNAYCSSCTPYGASAGAAQSTAVVYGLIGLGTDTGGSIALPASAASCFGLRPSWNLVSTRGVVPVNDYMDVVGPFARHASDLALVMDILDPSIRGRGFYDEIARGAENGISGLRIGVVADTIYDKVHWPMVNTHGTFVTFHLTDDVRHLVTKAILDLKSIGAELSNLTLHVQKILPYLSSFGQFDITSCSADWLNSYLSRLSDPAPYHSLNQLLRSRSLPESFQRFYESALRKSILQQCDTASKTFHKARTALKDHIIEPMFDGNKDVLLFPITADFPTRIHDRRDQPLIGVQLASLAGYPSLTLPIGFGPSNHEAPQGLPASVLLVSRPGRMDALIKVASAYQNRFGQIVLPESVSGCDGVHKNMQGLGVWCLIVIVSWFLM